MKPIILDAEKAVMGRLCSFAAKKALQGSEVIIVNCKKAIIKGDKKDIIKKYKTIREKGGHSQKGPYYSRIPYKMLKRSIRGMLPDHRRGIGKQALKKIRCFDEIPPEYKDEKMIKSGKTKPKKFIELEELSKKL